MKITLDVNPNIYKELAMDLQGVSEEEAGARILMLANAMVFHSEPTHQSFEEKSQKHAPIDNGEYVASTCEEEVVESLPFDPQKFSNDFDDL